MASPTNCQPLNLIPAPVFSVYSCTIGCRKCTSHNSQDTQVYSYSWSLEIVIMRTHYIHAHMYIYRDKSILFLFSLIFLSSNSFYLTCYAHDFARSLIILLKVKLYSYTYLTVTSYTCIIYLNCIYTSWTATAKLIIS